MKLRLFVLTCLLSLHPSFAAATQLLPLPDKPHLLIEGKGVIEQVPDLIYIRFDVSATAGSLSKAK